jgi:hypothetical protein
VAGQGLLVALPAAVVTDVALGGRQAVHVEPLEDAPDARWRHVDVVVAGQVHRDLVRPEVIVRPQVDDLADDLGVGLAGAVVGPAGPVAQALLAVLLEAGEPLVERGPADAVVAAGRRDVAGHLGRVTEHRQPVTDLALLFPFVHEGPSLEGPDVIILRQF